MDAFTPADITGTFLTTSQALADFLIGLDYIVCFVSDLHGKTTHSFIHFCRPDLI